MKPYRSTKYAPYRPNLLDYWLYVCFFILLYLLLWPRPEQPVATTPPAAEPPRWSPAGGQPNPFAPRVP
jgi:hypothetical protein